MFLEIFDSVSHEQMLGCFSVALLMIWESCSKIEKGFIRLRNATFQKSNLRESLVIFVVERLWSRYKRG